MPDSSPTPTPISKASHLRATNGAEITVTRKVVDRGSRLDVSELTILVTGLPVCASVQFEIHYHPNPQGVGGFLGLGGFPADANRGAFLASFEETFEAWSNVGHVRIVAHPFAPGQDSPQPPLPLIDPENGTDLFQISWTW